MVRKIGLVLAILVAIGVTGWAAAAIYFDSPLGSLRPVVAVLYLVAMLAAIVFLRPAYQGALVALAGFVIVALWWFSLKPSDQRNWQPDNAETAYADVNGDQVTIHNFPQLQLSHRNRLHLPMGNPLLQSGELIRRGHLHHVVGFALDCAPNRQLRFRRSGSRRHVY